jgi:phage terminase large subunit-like protein
MAETKTRGRLAERAHKLRSKAAKKREAEKRAKRIEVRREKSEERKKATQLAKTEAARKKDQWQDAGVDPTQRISGKAPKRASAEVQVSDERREQTVAELLNTGAGRRALSVSSPVFFDSFYCGMRHAAHRERWLETFEKQITTARESRTKSKLLVLAPRDHGKTEAAISVALRAVCLNRDIRVLWICESAGQAEKRMRRVKALLESQRIQGDWCSDPENGFGPFRVTEDDRWMATQVYVHRSKQSVDPTLEAVGAGGALTGGHFDLILADDLEDDRTTFSATQRQKTRDWFRGTISPMLVPGGTMIAIGTRKHHDDLYGHIIEDPTFRVMEDKAISKWPEEHKFLFEQDDRGRQVITGVEIKGKADVLWEAERPIEYLLRERQSIGSRLFSREFQNEVQDDSSAAFRMQWLEAAMERGRGLSLYQLPEVEGLDIVQGWDLALVTDPQAAESRDTDFTVGITWAKDNNGNRYLLGIRRKRGLSQAQLQHEVTREYYKFGEKIRSVAVERNSFGELHFMGLQRTTDLPLKPHLTTGKAKADPWEGVPSLSVLFENGKVIIPTGDPESREMVKPLIDELWGMGREKHDDTVMALWIAETVLRKGAFVHRIAFDDDETTTFESESEERLAGEDLLEDNPTARYVRDVNDSHNSRMWDGFKISDFEN